MTDYHSKRAVVARPPYMLYMAFTDMRNFLQYLPEDKRKDLQADYDSIHATVQGFEIGVRVVTRLPYSRISLADDGAPFAFNVDFCFDAAGGDPDKTEFHIDVSADLNFMMKMLIGGKIKEALDKIVDGIAAVSEGRMPEGFDPSMCNDFHV